MNHRLVYLYVSNGSSEGLPWRQEDQTQDPFAYHFKEEGFCYLFKRFLQEKIFDEILVVIESSRSPGRLPICQDLSILVVPHINELKPFLRPGDIIWARGGWRSWHDFLKEWHDAGNWLCFYRAASNRGAWPFWDIVFDDLIDKPFLDDLGRFYFPICKPTNPTMFFPLALERKYDLMIGASHVHEKKGQWKMMEILKSYKDQFKKTLRGVLPGGIHHGVNTSMIPARINAWGLDVELPGMVSRDRLNILYNESKIFVHCGGGGQNDRGPLEAMSCGTTIMLANPEYHAPHLRFSPYNFHISPDDPEVAARQIQYALWMVNPKHEEWRFYVRDFYEHFNGIEKTIIPQFKTVFNLLQTTKFAEKAKVHEALLGE